MKIRNLLILPLALAFFFFAVYRTDSGRQVEGLRQLEDALRRTAVSCYATNGFYPPNVQYMKDHFALQYDEDEYIVHYDLFASNLMPEISVFEN